MLLDLLGSVQSQPIRRLPLDHLIYEVSSIQTPVIGDILLPDPGLLGEYLLSDVLPRSPGVRPLPEHELVGADPSCVVVNGYSVVLAAHHLGSHVPRCPTSVASVIRPPVPSNP